MSRLAASGRPCYNHAMLESQIQILINGRLRAVPASWTVADLIGHLQLNSAQVAVEVNRQIIRRNSWPEALLNPGDQIEIVHFVGGGEDCND